MALVKPKHIALYSKYITQLIADLGQPVTLCAESSNTKCNNCVYDTVHKCSSGRYNGTGPQSFTSGICPVCKGKGVISSIAERVVICTVNWGQSNTKEELNPSEAGTIENNTCRLKSVVANYDAIKAADYIIIDGVRTKLISLVKRGLKEDVVCIAICKRDD